jgi:hypothetical protein
MPSKRQRTTSIKLQIGLLDEIGCIYPLTTIMVNNVSATDTFLSVLERLWQEHKLPDTDRFQLDYIASMEDDEYRFPLGQQILDDPLEEGVEGYFVTFRELRDTVKVRVCVEGQGHVATLQLECPHSKTFQSWITELQRKELLSLDMLPVELCDWPTMLFVPIHAHVTPGQYQLTMAQPEELELEEPRTPESRPVREFVPYSGQPHRLT